MTQPRLAHALPALATAAIFSACMPANPNTPYAPATGVLDSTLVTGVGFAGPVHQVTVQNDSRILAAGEFNSYNYAKVPQLSRLDVNGNLDSAFNSRLGAGPDNNVYALALASDGSVYLGGDFASISKRRVSHIAKISKDGVLSVNFLAGQIEVGFDRAVSALAIDPQGKLMAGGLFSSFSSARALSVARFFSETSIDQGFQSALGNGPNGGVKVLLADPDGHTLVGGSFTSYNGNIRGGLVRLNATGTEDFAFSSALGTGFDGAVQTIAEDGAGNYYVGGSFTSLAGQRMPYLVKLNHSGKVDKAFGGNVAPGPDGTVRALALDPQGNVVIGGDFRRVAGMNAGGLARLSGGGVADAVFMSKINSGFNDSVNTVAIQADGRILAGGAFTSFQGTAVNRLARIK